MSNVRHCFSSGSRADKVRRLNAERRSELHQDLDCWVAGAALDVADVGPVDPRFEGIVFLAPAFGGAQALQVGAKDLATVHSRCITCVATINLQTMSDKRLDCWLVPRMKNVTDK